MGGFDQSQLDKQPESWLFPVPKGLVALSDHTWWSPNTCAQLFHPWKRKELTYGFYCNC